MTKHGFGCGFVVNKRLRHLVSVFKPVNERIATIRIGAKFYNNSLTLVCASAPMEKKADVVKDVFYSKLEDVYNKCPNHSAKISEDD